VLATEVHDEEIVNVLGMHKDEMYLEVVPMTSPHRACTRAALSSEANSRLCCAESEQPCSQKLVHEEDIVNVPEMHKGEEVDVAPPGVPVGANAEVMQLAVKIPGSDQPFAWIIHSRVDPLCLLSATGCSYAL
jgi:hypothetical protein